MIEEGQSHFPRECHRVAIRVPQQLLQVAAHEIRVQARLQRVAASGHVSGTLTPKLFPELSP
jgi:hypothetical protein